MHRSYALGLRNIKYPRAGSQPHPWTVADILTACGFKRLPGPIAPTVIGILELGGGWRNNDLQLAATATGLPAPNVTNISVKGGQNSPGQPADGEVALDLQVAAQAYSFLTGKTAVIRCYFAPNTDAGFLGCYQQMRVDKVDAGSCSWGGPEDQWPSSVINSFAAELAGHAAAGIPQFAASGDNNSGDGESGVHADYPASDVSMIGCGGTTKTSNGETVWNNGNGEGTGGGYSALFGPQSWQIGAPAGPGRMVPDVAFNADPQTGYPIYVGGQSQVIGGTSAVAPIMAGIAAAFKGWLVGQSKPFPTNLLQWLWSHPAVFRDVIIGNNGQWKAGVGPDPCSGLGVLDGAALMAAITGGTVINPPPPPPPAGKVNFSKALLKGSYRIIGNGHVSTMILNQPETAGDHVIG
jgi:kumamolisin